MLDYLSFMYNPKPETKKLIISSLLDDDRLDSIRHT